MATSTSLCNRALSRIGEASVTLISDTGTTPELCTLHYAETVQELLRAHRWNFATKRTMLEPAWVTPTAIADSGAADLFRITKAAHGRTTGQRITIPSAAGFLATNYGGIAGTWRVTVIDVNTFDLDDSVFAGSGAVDCRYALAGVFGWSYSVALPTDCLRALEDDRAEGDADVRWVIEAGRVLTDSDELEFKYVEDVTDVDRFDPLFKSALVLALAVKFETALRGTSPQTAALAGELLQVTAPLARRIDANEGQPRERLMPSQSLFVAARSGRA